MTTRFSCGVARAAMPRMSKKRVDRACEAAPAGASTSHLLPLLGSRSVAWAPVKRCRRAKPSRVVGPNVVRVHLTVPPISQTCFGFFISREIDLPSPPVITRWRSPAPPAPTRRGFAARRQTRTRGGPVVTTSSSSSTGPSARRARAPGRPDCAVGPHWTGPRVLGEAGQPQGPGDG